MQNFEDYIKEEIKDGYISSNGTPLKCKKCDSKEFKDINKDQCEYGVTEFERICSDCGQVNGYWSYGNWQL